MDRRTRRTKRNIRNAFLSLIQKKGINEITITELSDLADIDRKTFYLHYSTVTDILLEIEDEVAAEVLLLLTEMKPFSLSEFLKGLNSIMERDIILYEQISRTQSFLFLKGQCKDILKSSLKEAFFVKSKLPEERFTIYAEYISSGIIGIYTDWLSDHHSITLDKLTEIASEAVSSGWKKLIVNATSDAPIEHNTGTFTPT